MNPHQKEYAEAVRDLYGPEWLKEAKELLYTYARARSEEERSHLRLAYYALLGRFEPRSGEALLLDALFTGLRTAEALDEAAGVLAGAEALEGV